MAGSLLSPAAALFQGAAQTESGISERAMQERIAADARRSKTVDEVINSAMQIHGANQRQQISEQGASERQQAEIESQFLTMTPTLKKGAAEVTGDPSWNEIPDGYKMRADVYSGLLSSGTAMYKMNQPQTLEVQEGDQVFTAEYDPKTRQLRKLTKGGEKFSPDQKDTSKTGGVLNPFTLQNIVRQDEKTLLTLLDGKGRKGIPSEGIIPGYSDKEKAKLATLRSLATRLRSNYTNLQKVEANRGLQPTEIDPEVLNTIDQLLAVEKPKPTGAAATKIILIGTDGKKYSIENTPEKVKKALENGFRRP